MSRSLYMVISLVSIVALGIASGCSGRDGASCGGCSHVRSVPREDPPSGSSAAASEHGDQDHEGHQN